MSALGGIVTAISGGSCALDSNVWNSIWGTIINQNMNKNSGNCQPQGTQAAQAWCDCNQQTTQQVYNWIYIAAGVIAGVIILIILSKIGFTLLMAKWKGDMMAKSLAKILQKSGFVSQGASLGAGSYMAVTPTQISSVGTGLFGSSPAPSPGVIMHQRNDAILSPERQQQHERSYNRRKPLDTVKMNQINNKLSQQSVKLLKDTDNYDKVGTVLQRNFEKLKLPSH